MKLNSPHNKELYELLGKLNFQRGKKYQAYVVLLFLYNVCDNAIIIVTGYYS